LVSGSLVLRDDGEAAARYGLLETLQQYAGEQLLAAPAGASSEAATVRDRHLDWCVALAEEAAS
jgi:predicted ATPase